MLSAFTTKRLVLRPMQQVDAPFLFEYRTDPLVAKFQDWRPENVEQTRSFIDAAAVDANHADHWRQLAIVLRAGEKLIGDCGLHFFYDEPRQVEFGITVAPTHQRQGYAAEAVGALLEFLFAGLGKHRAFASVDPRNVAAMALFQRIGMRKEAHFVESIWSKGQWVDDVVFALLDREWRSLQQPTQ